MKLITTNKDALMIKVLLGIPEKEDYLVFVRGLGFRV